MTAIQAPSRFLINSPFGCTPVESTEGLTQLRGTKSWCGCGPVMPRPRPRAIPSRYLALPVAAGSSTCLAGAKNGRTRPWAARSRTASRYACGASLCVRRGASVRDHARVRVVCVGIKCACARACRRPRDTSRHADCRPVRPAVPVLMVCHARYPYDCTVTRMHRLGGRYC